MSNFTCTDCGDTKPIQRDGGTGYGTIDGKTVCYACCGARDKATMAAESRMTLYLSRRDDGTYLVTNWPGTLKIPCRAPRKSPHNIARVRYDTWFRGPDGAEWHGVQYGDNTQILHCRKLKGRKA